MKARILEVALAAQAETERENARKKAAMGWRAGVCWHYACLSQATERTDKGPACKFHAVALASMQAKPQAKRS